MAGTVRSVDCSSDKSSVERLFGGDSVLFSRSVVARRGGSCWGSGVLGQLLAAQPPAPR